MIDSDIIFTGENVDRMEEHEEAGVVAGFYAKRHQDQTVWVANHFKKNEQPDERGLVKVETIGTGFMMIARYVFERMRDEGLAERYVIDGTDTVEYNFFPLKVTNGKYRSEDWAFCDNCHALGIEVYGDTRCVLRHKGTAMYPLPSVQTLERLYKAVDALERKGVKIPEELRDALDGPTQEPDASDK